MRNCGESLNHQDVSSERTVLRSNRRQLDKGGEQNLPDKRVTYNKDSHSENKYLGLPGTQNLSGYGEIQGCHSAVGGGGGERKKKDRERQQFHISHLDPLFLLEKQNNWSNTSFKFSNQRKYMYQQVRGTVQFNGSQPRQFFPLK